LLLPLEFVHGKTLLGKIAGKEPQQGKERQQAAQGHRFLLVSRGIPHATDQDLFPTPLGQGAHVALQRFFRALVRFFEIGRERHGSTSSNRPGLIHANLGEGIATRDTWVRLVFASRVRVAFLALRDAWVVAFVIGGGVGLRVEPRGGSHDVGVKPNQIVDPFLGGWVGSQQGLVFTPIPELIFGERTEGLIQQEASTVGRGVSPGISPRPPRCHHVLPLVLPDQTFPVVFTQVFHVKRCALYGTESGSKRFLFLFFFVASPHLWQALRLGWVAGEIWPAHRSDVDKEGFDLHLLGVIAHLAPVHRVFHRSRYRAQPSTHDKCPPWNVDLPHLALSIPVAVKPGARVLLLPLELVHGKTLPGGIAGKKPQQGKERQQALQEHGFLRRRSSKAASKPTRESEATGAWVG
jgi:hypothetical protein